MNLTPQEVAEIRAAGWAMLTTDDLNRLCDTIDALRGEVERLKTQSRKALEHQGFPADMIEEYLNGPK